MPENETHVLHLRTLAAECDAEVAAMQGVVEAVKDAYPTLIGHMAHCLRHIGDCSCGKDAARLKLSAALQALAETRRT